MAKKKEPVTTWNHRVIHQVQDDGVGGQETTFAIHEVYSTNGRPDSVTVNPVAATSESLAGLRDTLRRMLQAASKPVLEYEGFGDDGYHRPKERSSKKDGAKRRGKEKEKGR